MVGRFSEAEAEIVGMDKVVGTTWPFDKVREVGSWVESGNDGRVSDVVNEPPLGNWIVVGKTTGAEEIVALVGSGTTIVVGRTLPPGRVKDVAIAVVKGMLAGTETGAEVGSPADTPTLNEADDGKIVRVVGSWLPFGRDNVVGIRVVKAADYGQ